MCSCRWNAAGSRRVRVGRRPMRVARVRRTVVDMFADQPTTDLLDASLLAQAEALRAGAVSAPELLERCLARIAERDQVLNAFRAVRADAARGEARAAQARLDA